MELNIRPKNFKEIKEEINRHPHKYVFTERDGSGKGWICPICGSGSGAKGTGVTVKTDLDGIEHFTCWSGACFHNQTALNVLAIKNGVENDFIRLMNIAANTIGCDVTRTKNDASPKVKEELRKALYEESEPVNFSSFLTEAETHLQEADKYIKSRSLSLETAKHFHCGYVKDWIHPNALKDNDKSVRPSRRLIIPVTDYCYLARTTEETGNYLKLRAGKLVINGRFTPFNSACLKDSPKRVIFIVEGEIDAMSFYEIGFDAIGLCSISNIEKGVSFIAAHNKTKAIFIPLMDNEPNKSGENAQKKLIETLKARDVPYYEPTSSFPSDVTDANEYLKKSAFEFRQWAEEQTIGAINMLVDMPQKEVQEVIQEQAIKEAEEQAEPLKENKVVPSYFTIRNGLEALPLFLNSIQQSKDSEVISTGMEALDRVIAGGFRKGQMIVLGGLSGMNKTTCAIQWAVNMARSGHKVLYVSLEMAETELIGKIISLLTHEIVERDYFDRDIGLEYCPLSYGSILDGAIYDMNEGTFRPYSLLQEEVLKKAIEEYKTFSANFIIAEGIGTITADNVLDMAKNYYCSFGEMPIVFVDYLQILQETEEMKRSTDTEKVKYSVKMLKKLATGIYLAEKLEKDKEDLHTAVIVITSFNRNSYGQGAGEDSAKQAGDIEYTADLQLAIQPTLLKNNSNVQTGKELVQEEKRKRVKDVDIVITKSRRNVQPKDNPSFKLYNGAYFVSLDKPKSKKRFDDDF